jgi:hypothetical protein
MKRGALYIVWGTGYGDLLERSRASLKAIHPELPVEVLPGDAALGLLNKPRLMCQSPFKQTLYLDADTVVMGSLESVFERCGGLACCIGEHPWLRRYEGESGDTIEYNTGVLFFSHQCNGFLRDWRELSYQDQPASHFLQGDQESGLACDDQFSFGKAIANDGRWHPHVLPLNYNFRPGWMQTCFLPIKVWHSPYPVPEQIAVWNREIEAGRRLTTFVTLRQATGGGRFGG